MLKITNLSKSFDADAGEVHAVRGIDFEVKEGSFFTLLGPSGCGKTTTLRCVAGLEKPDSGEIMIDDQVVVSSAGKIFVPPYQREIAMVFQSYAIWPHMNVYDNVAFPLTQIKNLTRKKIAEKVKKALSMVQLDGLEKRPAPQLSGGQQQRLALARALAKEPKLILLDEPLSNLDAKLREEMRFEIKKLLRSLHMTALYVTHDQQEALVLSDLIAVMLEGKIIEINAPKEIYNNPRNAFSAGFIGTNNFFKGRVCDDHVGGQNTIVETQVGKVACFMSAGASSGDKVILAIRPEDIQIHNNKPDAVTNVLEAKIQDIAFLGDIVDCRVVVKEKIVNVRLTHKTELREGETIFVELPSESLQLLPYY